MSNLMQSVLHKFGVPQDSFGDSNGLLERSIGIYELTDLRIDESAFGTPCNPSIRKLVNSVTRSAVRSQLSRASPAETDPCSGSRRFRSEISPVTPDPNSPCASAPR